MGPCRWAVVRGAGLPHGTLSERMEPARGTRTRESHPCEIILLLMYVR